MDGQISDHLIAALSDSIASGRRIAARAARTERRLDGTGTGFAVGRHSIFDTVSIPVISQDGNFVTNHHVVANCVEVRLRPVGQEAVAAAVVARDPGNDLALLQAPTRLPAAELRDDRGIQAGDSIVAVGFLCQGCSRPRRTSSRAP